MVNSKVPTLSHVLIDSSVKNYTKSFNNKSSNVRIGERLERRARKQGVAGSIPAEAQFLF